MTCSTTPCPPPPPPRKEKQKEPPLVSHSQLCKLLRTTDGRRHETSKWHHALAAQSETHLEINGTRTILIENIKHLRAGQTEQESETWSSDRFGVAGKIPPGMGDLTSTS